MDLFGSSGVREVVGEDLTPPFVTRIATAATATLDADRVVIGRDTRVHGEMVAGAAASGIAAAGGDVDRLGVIPTPGVADYADREGIPAIVLTASHNPPQYGGMKLLDDDGVECELAVLERIESAYTDMIEDHTGDPERNNGAVESVYAHWDGTGRIERVDGATAEYQASIRSAVDRDAIAAADLTVAVDPGHGAGGTVSPALFRELGCRVLTVNAAPDGRFPNRQSEPTPDALTDLCRLVRTSDADVGIAHDGDADRAIFCDETGAVIPGASSFAALAASAVEPDDLVVAAVNASQRLVDAVEDAGGTLDLVRIGSTHIVARIRERQAAGDHVPIAGEGNGGVIFPDHRPIPDGAYIAAKFLERLTRQAASEVVAPFDGYEAVRHNVEYESDAQREAMVEAVESFADAAEGEVTTIDGYRIDSDRGWVLARPSGTEPVVRIVAESSDPDRAAKWANDLRETLVAAREDP